ncbi:hypothetical protein CHS0354_017544 [Potamilus streckersoni]|uniref:Uncharacterized protein n=1 Tax=Potamilus streckersoni TaxID=2493646 RepID=A0AAE0WCK7_9BIVA|nr:hypothetical protein CHS0354_017544 [Potamilus streckersoni]
MCNSKQSSDLDLPPFGTLIRVSEPDPAEDIKGQIRAMKRQATKMTPADRDDAHEENGVLFWVNKSGFPIDERTWNRMWDHVAKIHPGSYTMVKKIMGNTNLPNVPYPQPPSNISPTLSVPDRIEKIQNYMNALQYNHTGTQFFEIRKNRPISGLMECAKDMIREALPIKCLEAVILGIYLTNGMIGVERFPVSFNSTFNGCVHRHVVLGIYYAGRYGAIGMSRRMDLMYKPIVFRTLSELTVDFIRSYSKYQHDVKKIKIGMPISHDAHSYEFIQWKALTLNVSKLTQREMYKDIDQHSKEIRAKAKSFMASQSQSPRKSLSFVDFEAIKQAAKHSAAASNFAQATKVYQGISDTSKKKKEHTDIGNYQIRI